MIKEEIKSDDHDENDKMQFILNSPDTRLEEDDCSITTERLQDLEIKQNEE